MRLLSWCTGTSSRLDLCNFQACPLCREPLNASKVFIAAAFKPAEQVKEEDVAADIKTELNLDEKMPPSTKMIRSL